MASVQQVILISGPVAVGKTLLARALADRFDFRVLRTSQMLKDMADACAPERLAMQEKGRSLDEETNGQWVVDAAQEHVRKWEGEVRFVVDSIRIEEQAQAFRRAYDRRVLHVHLTASEARLKQRYESRSSEYKEPPSYDDIARDPTEQQARLLDRVADVVVDTEKDEAPGNGVMIRVAARLGLFGSTTPLVDVLIGGQYGSEGKGQVAAYLAPEYELLVRVGGPNAGHTVWNEPEPDVFHHLPSGTNRAPRAHLLIGPGATINPDSLIAEAAKFEVDRHRLSVDPHAMIIERNDIEAEQRLKEEISSTAQGVGIATSRKVLRTNAEPCVNLAKDIPELRPFVRPAGKILEDAYAAGHRILFEGTQGSGLSLHHGHYPYVTSRETSVSGCLAEAGIPPGRVRRVIMVCRTYPIRVQNPPGKTSGPLEMEISFDEISARSGIPLEELEQNERTSTTGRRRRIAEFDWTLLRRAASLNGPSDIALTFADYLCIKNRTARRFEQLTPKTILFVEEVERVAGGRVSLIATRFHSRSIIDRRSWTRWPLV
ncbi:MAG: adenylosuccinate synthetase [Gemmatimonadetes bacterium]|nr:adenylosuccinate synthetase [Gemmatimonadota bacterium]